MGNCCTKSKVNPEAQTSRGIRVKNGGWKRKVMKRLGLAKYSARVDISPEAEDEEIKSSSSVDDTEVPLPVKREVSSRQNIDTDKLEESESVLILFYARAEVTDDNEIQTHGNLLTERRDSPFFSSEESLYDGFEDTESIEELEIEEEIHSENDSSVVYIDTSALSGQEDSRVHDHSLYRLSSNDKNNDNLPSGSKEATSKEPEYHFFASSVASRYTSIGEADDSTEDEILEEIPEELPDDSSAEDGSEEYLKIATSDDKIYTRYYLNNTRIVEQKINGLHVPKGIKENPEISLKDEKTETSCRHSCSVQKNVLVQETSDNKRNPSNFKHSVSMDNVYAATADKPSVTALRKAISSASRQSVISEELKSRISATSLESMEKLLKAKSECTFKIFVRSAEPDIEPREIKVRASTQQVKDGAAIMFVKSLRNVANPVAHFDPYQQVKKTKQHINKSPPLVLTDRNAAINCIQKPGTAPDVQLAKVPQFYEPPPKKQNAREKLGLENLQKYNIKVQCKAIERIKIDEDQFPGILPPRALEQWKKKRQEKRPVN